jgi:hypothetical protein
MVDERSDSLGLSLGILLGLGLTLGSPSSSLAAVAGSASTPFVYPSGALIHGNACGALAASPPGQPSNLWSRLLVDFHYLEELTPTVERLRDRFVGDAQFSLSRVILYFRSIADEFKDVFANWKKQFKELSGILDTSGYKFDEDIGKVQRDVEQQLKTCPSSSPQANRDCVLKLAVDLFRHQIAGAIGEVRAAFHFRERVIQNNAHLEDITLAKTRETAAAMRNEVRKTGNYSTQGKGRISLNERIDYLIETFEARRQRGQNPKAAFAALRTQFPTLFGQFEDHDWLHALRRLRRLEVDLVTVGEDLPLALVEVKAFSHEVDLPEVSASTYFGRRLSHSLEQMYEFQSLLKLTQHVEISVFFPGGITPRAIAQLQKLYPGIKIYTPGSHVSAPRILAEQIPSPAASPASSPEVDPVTTLIWR